MKVKIIKLIDWKAIDIDIDSLDDVMEESRRVAGNLFSIADPKIERLLAIEVEHIKDITLEAYEGKTAEQLFFKE